MFRPILVCTTILLGAGTASALPPPTPTPPHAAPLADPQAGSPAATRDAHGAGAQGWVRDSLDAARRGEGRVLFDSGDLLSVLRHDRAYGDGGESVWLVPVNWDVRAGRLIPIEAVFGAPESHAASYAGLAKILRAATVQQVWGGNPGPWRDEITTEVQPDPAWLSTFTFVPSTLPGKIGGIAWHFAPEVIAPAGRGTVSVTLPQAALRDLVVSAWRDRFGGQPADAVSARSAVPAGTPL